MIHSSLSYVDVAEVMGEEGRTTQVLILRHYRGGENFDCVLVIDLMIKKHELELYDYLHKMRPFVFVMAPQCTGMAGWGHLNKVLNKETHEKCGSIQTSRAHMCTLPQDTVVGQPSFLCRATSWIRI